MSSPECGDAVAGKRAIFFVEDDKIVAIEARQTFVRAEPQIAVLGLRDGADRILRQSMLLSPNSSGILRERAARIECEARRNAQNRQQRSARTPACRVHTRVNACSVRTKVALLSFRVTAGRVAAGRCDNGVRCSPSRKSTIARFPPSIRSSPSGSSLDFRAPPSRKFWAGRKSAPAATC